MLLFVIEQYNPPAFGRKKASPASASRHRQQTTVAPAGRSTYKERISPAAYPVAPTRYAATMRRVPLKARVATVGAIRLVNTSSTPTSCTEAVTVTANSR